MTYTESLTSFEKLFDGHLDKNEATKLLVGLYKKGESIDEIRAAVEIMRQKSIQLPISKDLQELIIDNCGTGGDKSGSFNISTTVSFILAAAGCYVAKHGNRSITSKSGSADMLEVLGIRLDLDIQKQVKLLEDCGFTFLFAQNHHPAMKHIMPIRKSLSHRTIFNILGPLTNPAGAKKQFIGVFDRSFTQPIAEVLKQTGTKSAMVVNGHDGLDEITISAPSVITHLDGDIINNYEFIPSDYGIDFQDLDVIKGGDANENAQITKNILNGIEYGGKRDIVLINAAAAFIVDKKASSFEDGIALAKEIIDSKKAINKLNQIIEISNKL